MVPVGAAVARRTHQAHARRPGRCRAARARPGTDRPVCPPPSAESRTARCRSRRLRTLSHKVFKYLLEGKVDYRKRMMIPCFGRHVEATIRQSDYKERKYYKLKQMKTHLSRRSNVSAVPTGCTVLCPDCCRPQPP